MTTQPPATLAPGCASIVLRGPAGPLRGAVYWPRLPLPPVSPRPAAVVLSPRSNPPLPPDRLARSLAVGARITVLALTVSGSPADAADDLEAAWAAVEWAADHAREIDGDPDRLMVIGQAGAHHVATAVAARAGTTGWPVVSRLVLVRSGPGPPSGRTAPAEPVPPVEWRHRT